MTLENKYSLEYIKSKNKPTLLERPQKRIHAIFYATGTGKEPVKVALLELGRPTQTIVGEDIRFVELNWRVDRPYVDRLRSGHGEFEKSLYEVRHTLSGVEYRTLFFVSGAEMILVHFFKKTSRKTPKLDLEIAWDRMKKWMSTEKESQRQVKKVRGHGKKC